METGPNRYRPNIRARQKFELEACSNRARINLRILKSRNGRRKIRDLLELPASNSAEPWPNSRSPIGSAFRFDERNSSAMPAGLELPSSR